VGLPGAANQGIPCSAHHALAFAHKKASLTEKARDASWIQTKQSWKPAIVV
jgi:hypothetical protein